MIPPRSFAAVWPIYGSARISRVLPTAPRPAMPEADTELLTAVARVVEAFDALGVDYLTGGSVASSVFGEPRQTLDADLVARLFGRHAEPPSGATRR